MSILLSFNKQKNVVVWVREEVVLIRRTIILLRPEQLRGSRGEVLLPVPLSPLLLIFISIVSYGMIPNR